MDDVIVIGAGPSGSVVARLLALQGFKVRMLDRAVFPRRKACGESLNPGAVAALARVGTPVHSLLMAADKQSGSIVRGWRLRNERTELSVLFPDGVYGFGCKRERLDEALVREACRAGVMLEEGRHAEGLLWDELGCASGVYGRDTVTKRPFRLQAKIVVAADGLRSAAVRSAGLACSPGRLKKAALTAHVSGMTGIAETVELHVEPSLVIGIAPLGGGMANMTIVVPGAAAAGAAGDKTAFMLRTARGQPWLSERLEHIAFEGDVLASGPFDRPVRAAAMPGLVLVGDAAGYYDPLTGQGIFRAVRSAELAAPRIAEWLEEGGAAPLKRYERERQREFAPGMRLQRIIEWGTGRPAVWNAAIRGLGAMPHLRETVAGWIGDCPKQGLQKGAGRHGYI